MRQGGFYKVLLNFAVLRDYCRVQGVMGLGLRVGFRFWRATPLERAPKSAKTLREIGMCGGDSGLRRLGLRV